MDLAAQELARTGAANEFPIFNHAAAARENGFWRALRSNALKHGIIHSHVVCFRADHILFVRIKNHEVGVRTHGNGSFAWVESEKFRGRGGDKLDEAVGGEALAVNAARVNERSEERRVGK